MRWEPLQIRIEPTPTAAAVGVFLPAAAIERTGLRQTGAKVLVRLRNECLRKAAACSKTRRRGVLSRAPGEDALKAANKKPPPANAGRGEAALKKYRDGTQKNAVMPSEPGTL